ncbi:hypothetical protein DIPPA_00675 [Diplonema papillatum]|nr:hypothetical protein DIPPA_00675 [Diplonema papillatum]|eukprot:gene3568-5537_t
MVLRTVGKPVSAILGAMAGSADARVIKYYNSDFKAHLTRARETGEDVGNTVWGRFVVQSLLTIPDRFVTLGKEAASLPSACMVWSWGAPDWLQFFQFFIRLAFVYLAFKCVGRESVLALVPTNSIFWQTDEPVAADCSTAQSIAAATEWASPIAQLMGA